MNRRRLHGWLLLGACVLLAGVCAVLACTQAQRVFGVQMMNGRAYSRLPEYAYDDLGDYLTQNGQPAAVDREASVIYVSLDVGLHDDIRRMPVTFALHHPGYRLYFAPDAAFDDFAQAVRGGHRFTLIAASRSRHMRYEVVFTALPVVRLSTQKGSDESEHEGSFCLWSDYPSGKGYYSVSASQARWHRRGGISRSAEKASYKITLEKPSGENNSMPLLDMGSDDDWILNSMVKDDLKLREMVVTTLWNEHQKTTQYQIPMAPCRYAEVVADGEYRGLYLLQRRVDNKLLSGQYAGDAIYKGNVNYGTNVRAETALGIQYNPMQIPAQELHAYIRPFYDLLVTGDSRYDVLKLNEENWLDLNVFCSVFAMGDNTGSKNIFLIRHEQDGECTLHFALWDTDMSMGLGWRDDDVRYTPENVNTAGCLRREAGARFARDGQIRAAYVDTYSRLRAALLSQENILQTVLGCHEEIAASGALARDQARWGLHNGGEDTLEKLLDYIRIRTAWLDETYLGAE